MNALHLMADMIEMLVEVHGCACQLELSPDCQPHLEVRVGLELKGEVIFDQQLGFLVTTAHSGEQARFDDSVYPGDIVSDIVEHIA